MFMPVMLNNSNPPSADASASGILHPRMDRRFYTFESPNSSTGKGDIIKTPLAKWQRKPLGRIGLASPIALGNRCSAFRRMAANRDVEAIKLDTALGNMKLNISAILRMDALQIAAKYALAYLIWHVAPSKAFNKDTGIKRDAEYSDKLTAHFDGFAKTVLGLCFSDITIAYSKRPPKADTAEGIIASIDKLTPEQLAKVLAKAQASAAAKASAAEETETSTEAPVQESVAA